MAVELVESFDSREFRLDATSASGTWRYTARVTAEADPEDALYQEVYASAPFYWNGLARQTIVATPVGGGVYRVEVPYLLEVAGTAAQDPTQTPDPSTGGPGGGPPSGTPTGPASEDAAVGANVTMEIGGRPPKLLTSIATLSSGGVGLAVPPGAVVDAPDHQRAINVGQDGRVEGVEIDDPGVIITLTYKFDTLSWKYINRLRGMVWKTNNAVWFTFKQREAALLGATIATGDDARGTITFRIGLRSETTIAAGKLRDDGTNILPQADVTFRGWDYLWVAYEEATSNNRTVSRPTFYYVEQVLEEENFTLLGIGG